MPKFDRAHNYGTVPRGADLARNGKGSEEALMDNPRGALSVPRLAQTGPDPLIGRGPGRSPGPETGAVRDRHSATVTR